MIVDRWKLEKAVRDKPGITPTEVGQLLGVGAKTVLRHVKRYRVFVVEPGRVGRGNVTRIWCRYDYPTTGEREPRNVPTAPSKRGLRVFTLDDF